MIHHGDAVVGQLVNAAKSGATGAGANPSLIKANDTVLRGERWQAGRPITGGTT